MNFSDTATAVTLGKEGVESGKRERRKFRFIKWWFKFYRSFPMLAPAKRSLSIRHLFAYEYLAAIPAKKQRAMSIVIRYK